MNTALCVLLILLVPLAAAGISLINTGMVRSRSAAHAMLSALCAFGTSALVYIVAGYAVRAAAPNLLLRGVALDSGEGAAAVLFEIVGVSLAAMIPLGSGGDRWRLGSICISSALMSGVTYPLYVRFAAAGGWLAQLGLVDAGGAGSIQVIGGLTALSIAWLIGPRRGKYTHEGMPTAIPGHHAVLVLFGCLLALPGWIGLNSAGAILFASADPAKVALIAINTIAGAAGAALATALITRIRFTRPDASLCANGWVGGLVAVSAGCASIRPVAAAVIGIIAGVLVAFSVEWFDLHFGVDDPGGAISVHAVSGIWGLLAAGLFASTGQWLPQVVAVGTLAGFTLPLTYLLNWMVNRLYPQRVGPEGERQGMDLYELGAGAYPDFVTHREDFLMR